MPAGTRGGEGRDEPTDGAQWEGSVDSTLDRWSLPGCSPWCRQGHALRVACGHP